LLDSLLQEKMPRGETRVFLGNLPAGVRVRDVEEFFKKIGRVRNVLIKHGKYGFAEFENSRDAEDAVHDMHGRRILGSRITVEFAKGTQHIKEPRRAPWVSKYGAPQRTKFRLKVLNLSSRISWQDLKDTLRKAGEVTFAEAHINKRHEGRVELASMEDLERVLKRYQGYDMNGRRIELVKDCEKEKSKSKSNDGNASRSQLKSGSRSRSRSRQSRSGTKRSRSRSRLRSKESFSRGKRSRSRSEESCSSGKSESISPSKKVDLDDKDVKRLRKRSHSQSTESKRSGASRASKVSKNSERSLSNSIEKEMRRSLSAASEDKLKDEEESFEREDSERPTNSNADENKSE